LTGFLIHHGASISRGCGSGSILSLLNPPG
jgi:hypothetical protein